MALTGFPAAAKLEWNSTAYFLNPSTLAIQSAVIEKITAEVTDPAGDSSGSQLNMYTLAGYSVPLPESKVFHSKNALLYSLKGTYLNKFASAAFGSDALTGGTTNDYSYSDFESVDFSGTSDLNEAVLDGCKLTSANFTNAVLTNCSMKYAILTGAELTGANMAGVNLTGATMPAAADSKSEFKALVSSYTGAIWTDGTTVT